MMRVLARRRASALFGLLTLSTPTLAQGPGFEAEGTYVLQGRAASIGMKVIVLDAPDTFAASFQTATRGCGGAVGATGKAVGKSELVFTKKDELGGQCTIEVRFSPDFKRAQVDEDGCLAWHGAACSFSGELRRIGP